MKDKIPEDKPLMEWGLWAWNQQDASGQTRQSDEKPGARRGTLQGSERRSGVYSFPCVGNSNVSTNR
jgi:hypothetical protein